jgi:hypothetical protein
MADANRSVHPNALPNNQNAIVPPNKLLKYSLDQTHPRGKHKAIVFQRALGFEQSNWELLRDSILAELPYYEAQPTITDAYGKRYKVIMPVTGPNGSTRDIVVTWIVKAGTDYPSLDSTWVKKR